VTAEENPKVFRQFTDKTSIIEGKLPKLILLIITSISLLHCKGSAFRGSNGKDDPPPPAPSSPSPPPAQEQIATAEIIDAPITFELFNDRAAYTNCLALTIDDKPEIEIGCNRDASGQPKSVFNKTLQVKRKPACNHFQLRFFTKVGASLPAILSDNADSVYIVPEAITTETLNYRLLPRTRKFFLYKDAADPDWFGAFLNDNNDAKTDIDFHFRIKGFKDVDFSIKNAEAISTCKS